MDGVETLGGVGATGAGFGFETIGGVVTLGRDTVGTVVETFTVVTVSVGSDPATAVPRPLAKANPTPPRARAQIPAAVRTLR